MLREATKSLKQLQERVKLLEAQTKSKSEEFLLGENENEYVKKLHEHAKFIEEEINKKSEEPIVVVKNSQLSVASDSSSCDKNFAGNSHADIEARISENCVLIKVHCQNQKGLVAKLLNKMENLHLSVTNSYFLPFGQKIITLETFLLQHY